MEVSSRRIAEEEVRRGVRHRPTVGGVVRVLVPPGIGEGAELAVVVEDELDVDAVLLGAFENLVQPPPRRERVASDAVVEVGPVPGTPLERTAVEVGHPDPRPVLFRAVERREELLVVARAAEPGRVGLLEGDVVADRDVRVAVVEPQRQWIVRIAAHEATRGAREHVESPGHRRRRRPRPVGRPDRVRERAELGRSEANAPARVADRLVILERLGPGFTR